MDPDDRVVIVAPLGNELSTALTVMPGDDLVDAVQDGLVEHDVGRRELSLELFRRARTDERRGDRRGG